jgi:hypothetical protein
MERKPTAKSLAVDATEVLDSRDCRCGIHFDFFQPLFHAGPNRQGYCAHSSLVPNARFLDTHPSSALRYSQRRACH